MHAAAAAAAAAAAVNTKETAALGDTPGGSAFSSLESLTDMTQCPVHCGPLERPKLLPCGHVFCSACLDKWSERQNGGVHIECPMCRRCVPRPAAGASELPSARAHQAILDYLVSHVAKKMQRCKGARADRHGDKQRRPSLELKQDLLAQLSEKRVAPAAAATPADGPGETTGQGDARFDREELAGPTEPPSVSAAVEEAEQDDTDDVASSAVSSTSVEGGFTATQRAMHRDSRYQMRQLTIDWDAWENGEIAGASLVMGSQAGSGSVLVLLTGEGSRRLMSQRFGGGRGSQRRQLNWETLEAELTRRCSPDGVRASGGRLRVGSMQVSQGEIFLAGWVGTRSILASVNGPGDVTRDPYQVVRFHCRQEATEAEAAAGFAGFHADATAPDGVALVATQPRRRRLEFYDGELRPNGHWMVFDRVTPRHVAWSRRTKTLWVSCPDERLVLAVNDTTGVYRKLETGGIFLSPPGHLVASEVAGAEARVILSDTGQGRLYWIAKRHKYIFLQRLHLPRELPGDGVTAISAVDSTGWLLVATRDRLFRLKPETAAVRASGSNRQQGRNLKCQLL